MLTLVYFLNFTEQIILLYFIRAEEMKMTNVIIWDRQIYVEIKQFWLFLCISSRQLEDKRTSIFSSYLN